MRFHEIVPIFNLLVGRRLDIAVFGPCAEGRVEWPSAPRTYLLHGDELANIRQRWKARERIIASSVDSFLAYADQILPLPARSVREKQGSVWGEAAGDYVSLARYWWPSSDSPDGLPFVLHDGEINPDVYSEKFDLSRLEEFTYHAFVLAFAYAVSGDEVYARRCAELIEHWCLAPESRQSPHFEYAQIRPGHKRGGGVGTIEAHRLIYVVEAAQMIAASPHWPEEKAVSLKAWFSSLLTWLRTSKAGMEAGARTNNIGVWYDVQCATYALYTGDAQLAGAIVQDSGMRRLSTQLGPNGAFPAELVRTRPYDYFAFNLLAYMALARMGEAVDVDLWTRELPDGRSLEAAVQWLRNVVQPEALSFDLGLRAARLPQDQLAENGAAALHNLVRALSDEVESLRWKVRAAAADRAELVTLLREQQLRAERLRGVVAAIVGGRQNNASQVADGAAANVRDTVRGESMEHHKMSEHPMGADDVRALGAELDRLHQERAQCERERMSANSEVSHLERRLREAAAAAQRAEHAADEARGLAMEAARTRDRLKDELQKALRKIAGLEAAVPRIIRARAEGEGRLRDRFEYLLQEQASKAEKKLATEKLKRRDVTSSLQHAVDRMVTLQREHEQAVRRLAKAQSKEKRKRRASEEREQQALEALGSTIAAQEQLAVRVARLTSELGQIRRPILERVTRRIPGRRPVDQSRREESVIQSSGIVELLGRLQGTQLSAAALLHSSIKEDGAACPLFAYDWYVARYPGAVLRWSSPLAEYLAEGWRESRRPHPLFWGAWYAKRYLADQPDVCPLVHFLANAEKKDLDPNPFFDSRWYRERHMGAREVDTIPLIHYIRRGRAAGFDTSPRVSLGLVRERFAAARVPGADALAVFLALSDDERKMLVRSTQHGGELR